LDQSLYPIVVDAGAGRHVWSQKFRRSSSILSGAKRPTDVLHGVSGVNQFLRLNDTMPVTGFGSALLNRAKAVVARAKMGRPGGETLVFGSRGGVPRSRVKFFRFHSGPHIEKRVIDAIRYK